MNVRGILITLIAFLVTCNAGEGKRSHLPEQREFSAEQNSVERPVPIPKAVLSILKEDEDVRSVLEDEGIPSEKIPLSWFLASGVHLSGPEQVDLVVIGIGPLRGANVVTFWVFRATHRGYELVLSAPAHNLILKNTLTNGHHDIELRSITARQISTVLCRFDGRRYQPYRTKTEPIQQEGASLDQKGHEEHARLSFGEIEAMLRHKSSVPPRLPSFLHSDYAIVKSATSTAYEVLSGTVPDCQGQNYCLLGSALGSTAPIQLAGRSSGVPVKLQGGIQGKFIAAECHAYCNQSYFTWSEGGFYYAIGIKAGKKEELIRAAGSAIPTSQ